MSNNPSTRLEELQRAISERLKKVCYDWPIERFDRMVQNLAFITLKYERELVRVESDRPTRTPRSDR